MVLEEKWEEILEQYDFHVKRISWARGAKLLDTDQGLFQLRQFTGKPRQLALEDAVTSGLLAQGCRLVDTVVRTKEGLLYAQGAVRKYGRGMRAKPPAEEDVSKNPAEPLAEPEKEEDVPWWKLSFPENRDIYVVRRWFPGEEGNFRSAEFLKRAALTLGKLHNRMALLEIPKELTVFHPSMALSEIWKKHNRELKRIRRYILDKKKKNEFEILFLSMQEGYLEAAQKACEFLEKGSCRELFLEAEKKRLFCHGNYNYHNLIDSRQGLATVCFENTGIGVPVFDLYQMMRKLLEKNHWNRELAAFVLQEYEKQRQLTEKEKELLYLLLLYPEKFWKVSNHYYNSRKSWINRIDIAKLEELGRQQERRKETLEYLRNY